MLIRQKLIIALIKCSGGSTTRLKLVKQVFLLRQHLSPRYTHAFYQFLPYKYGPFSFTLYHELQKMIDSGLIELPSSNAIRLTDLGLQTSLDLPPNLWKEFGRFWANYGQYPVNELTELVYAQHPWYATRSERNRHYIPLKEAPYAVYTVGYSSMQVDGFLNLLLRSGIKQLIDVRRNAVSRVFGFYGSTLANLAKYVDIEYRHMPQVGIPSEWRACLDDQDDLDMLFNRYTEEVLNSAEDLVRDIASWMSSKPSTLMCMEVDPSRYHRSVLAESISDSTGLTVSDLRWPNGNRLSSNTCIDNGHDVSSSITRVQGTSMYCRDH
ncbi:MAG: DUF488 family protein [Firmicutes bacterium]|nr:DUF488 family protein [Candidatus Fermentithermobacillaceae bacterium]